MSVGFGSSLGQATGSIIISTGDSEKNIKALGASISGLDAKTSKFGAAANIGKVFAGIGASILGGLGLATNAAANFEQRMSGVKAVTGAAGATFDALSDKAIQLGKATVFTATEAAGAIEQLARQGVSVTNILSGAADAAVSLAAAGGIAIADSAGIIANAMDQFSLNGDQAIQIADLFAAASATTAANVTDLGEALEYVGATAHAVGTQLPETVALIAALSDQGLQGSAAGTALNQMILSLVNPTSQATDELNALGISAFDATGKFIGAEAFVKKFAAATKGMTDQERLAAEGIIFTTHGLNALNLLLNDTTDEANARGKSLDDYNKKVGQTGAAATQAAARLDNFRGSLEQLKGSVETGLIRIGDTFLPAARKIVDGATAIVNAILGLPDPVIKAAAAIAGLTGALASGLGLFILFEPKIKKFIKTFNEIKPALAGIAAPALGVAAGFAIIGLAYEKNFAGIKDKIGSVVNAIKGKFNDITKIAKQARAGIDEVLSIRHGDAIGVLANVFDLAGRFENLGVGAANARKMAFAVNKLRLPITRLINDLLSVNDAASAFIDIMFGGGTQQAYAKLAKAAEFLFGRNVGKQFVQATAQMRVALKGLVDAFKAVTGIDAGKLFTWPGIFTAVTNAGAKLATWIDQGFLKLGPPLVAMLQLTTRAFDFLAAHMDAVVGTVRGVAGAIADDLGGALTTVGKLITGDFSGAWEAFSGLVQDALSQVVDVGSVAISVAEWLWDQSKDVVGSVSDWVTGKIGPKGVRLLTVGVAVADWLWDKSKDVVHSATTWVTGKIGTALKIGKIALDGTFSLARTIGDVGGWLWGQLRGHWDGIVSFGKATLHGAFELGSKLGDLGGWLWGQLRAGWNGIVPFGKATLNGAYALGSKLGDVGAWLWGQLKGNWNGIVSFGKATLDGAYNLADGAADKAAGIVEAILHNHVISISDWKVSFKVPSGNNITVDTKGVWDAVFKALNYSPTFSPDQIQSAHDIGHSAGVSTKDAIVQGFADALNGAGGNGKTTGSLADVPGHGATSQVSFGDLVKTVIQGYLGGFTWTGSSADLALADVLNRTADDIQTRLSNWNPLATKPEKPKKADPKPLVDFGAFLAGIWNFKSDTTWSSLLKPLDDQLQSASDAVAGWLNGLGDKFLSLIGLGPGGGTPAMATGAGFALPGAGGNPIARIITDAIKGLFDFDFSGLHLPTIPNFNAVLGPLEDIVKQTNRVAGELEKAWNNLQRVKAFFGIGGGDKAKNTPPGSLADVPGHGTIDVQLNPFNPDGSINTGGQIGTPVEDPIKPLISGLGFSNVRVGAGGFTADAPPVSVNVPLSYVFKTIGGAGNTDPMARNKPEPGSDTTQTVTTKFLADDSDVARKYTDVFTWGQAWAAASFTGQFLGDNADAAVKYTDAFTWGQAWGSASFTGLFLGDNSDAAVKYSDAFTWGDAWGGATFTGIFAGDNGPAAIAYTDAFTWGDIWDSTTFTARFDVDTTGITNAVAIANAAAAQIAAVMPHSPAKKGPLKKPIKFDYIANNMQATAKRLKAYANSSANVLADAFGMQPTTAAQFAAAQVNSAGGGGGTSVQQQFFALHSDEFARLLAQAQQGSAAYGWIGTAHG